MHFHSNSIVSSMNNYKLLYMRKVLLFFVLLAFGAFPVNAQKVATPSETRYVYCFQEGSESAQYPGPVVLNFGKVAKDNGCLRAETPVSGHIRDANNKPIQFETFFDFVNYMGILGWQYSSDTDAFRKTLKKDQKLDDGLNIGPAKEN